MDHNPLCGQATSPRERFLEVLLNSATDYAIIALDLAGLVTSWNEGARCILGWSEGEMLGRPASLFFTQADREQGVPQAEMQAALEHGRGASERWHQKKDGSCFWSNGEIMPLRDEAGAVQGFVRVLRDRTEQRLVAEKHRSDAEFLRSVLASSADCIKVLDLDAKLVFMTESGQRVMEVSDFNAIQGCPWPDFWHDQGNLDARVAVETAKAGGTGHFQGLSSTMAGTPKYWDVQVTPIMGADGQPEKLLSVSRDITAARQVEEALRESEVRLSAIFAQAGVGLSEIGLDGRFLRVNDELCRILGLARHAALSTGIAGVTLQDDIARSLVVLAEIIKSGEPASVDIRYVRPDGSVVWANSSLTRLDDEQGRPRSILAVTVDLTSRRAAEESLRASEARFQAIADSIDQMVWSTRPDGFHDYYNQRWYDYTGVQAGSTDGESWNGVFHPDDRQRAWAAWHHSLRTGAPYRIEYRLRHRSGRYRWVLGRAQAVRDEAGQIIRWYGTCTVIQEIVDAREVLARSQAELQRLVAERTSERDRMWRLSTDVMVMAKFDSRITAVNPAWTTVFGWKEHELIGRSSLNLVHPDDAESTLAAVRKLSDRQTTVHFQNRYRQKDGGYRWLSWTAVPDEGFIYAVGRDITAEKEAAAQLAAMQEQLRQSQKMEAVGQLTGGLAHDFNNLLTGIAGNLELLQTRVNQGRLTDLDRYISAAQGASKRAAALTHRLLAFSRRQTLDPKPTNINRLVTEMEDLISRTVGPAVGIEVVGAPGLWTTLVDPNQLENALLNLCINARDAMAEGGRLTIETANRCLDEGATRERDMPPGQYLSLCVTDTGCGMTPEVVSRAFDPFFTTKPIGVGTGLGLSMVYGFARQSGGQVRIYSEAGRGTRVCLYLPRHHDQADDTEAPAEPDKAPVIEQGKTVLVVDDEPAVRMLVVEVLEDLGYATIEAADGAGGLKVLQSDVRINLMVTDVGLPGGMNGRQVADAGRAIRPDLRVLFITGYAENAVVGNGNLEPGMQVLTKPFAMEALASRVTDLIAGS